MFLRLTTNFCIIMNSDIINFTRKYDFDCDNYYKKNKENVDEKSDLKKS